MAIYTGNNGRVYIARRQSSGLSAADRTLNIIAGQAITAGVKLTAITVSGAGSGAEFQAKNAVTTAATTRSCTFTPTGGGSGYEANTIIYLARYASNTWVRMTSDFEVGSVQTVGIDSEAELTTNNYRVAKIRDWSYNSTSEVIETTALGDVTKTYAPSITSGDGSATLMFYEDDLNAYGGGSMKDIYELVNILFPRDVAPRVIMNLAVDGGVYNLDLGTEVGKTNFMFNAYITSASVSVSYGEVVTVNTSFTVDGPLLDVPNRPGAITL
jgi:hypothetical protein